MTDPIRDAAIEAAAKAYAEDGWEGYNPFVVRTYVTPLVDAVLAVARPAYRAEAWDEGAKSMMHAVSEEQAVSFVAPTNPYRADAEERS